ncbi:FAD-dependent oxidoreductase [Candidatus Woesearchaeota archaeon]|nr:FAD-dependent oxidoreductase [Candidatus Woesearchaeota archaeon]
MPDCYITIIGGGIIGNAVAYELSQIVGNQVICVLDKNPNFPGENQTARSSEVVHAGIYYDKAHSPLKARLCVEGNKLIYEFCRRYGLPIRQTGKIIVATNQEEDRSLDELLYRARENEVPGVEKIGVDRIRELEPNVKSYSALWVPTSGILDSTSLVCKLRDLSNLGDLYLLGTELKNIVVENGEFLIKANTKGVGENEFTTKYVINAAGLYSDEIARMVNPNFPLRIFPVRGEAVKFYQTREDIRVSRNVYPSPIFYDKPDGTRHLTVGVHLTPRFAMGRDGNFLFENGDFVLGKEITVGPLNRKKGDEIGKEDFGSDLAPISVFLENIKEYFPGVSIDDLQLHQTGIQAVLANSQDFHIARDELHPNMINLVGICSPGLTSSLAIAKRVREIIKNSERF